MVTELVSIHGDRSFQFFNLSISYTIAEEKHNCIHFYDPHTIALAAEAQLPTHRYIQQHNCSRQYNTASTSDNNTPILQLLALKSARAGVPSLLLFVGQLH
jgi:hypothetical protein